jgi:hypothetical protein
MTGRDFGNDLAFPLPLPHEATFAFAPGHWVDCWLARLQAAADAAHVAVLVGVGHRAAAYLYILYTAYCIYMIEHRV